MNHFYVYEKGTGTITFTGVTADVPVHDSETEGYVLGVQLPRNTKVIHNEETGELEEITVSRTHPDDLPTHWGVIKHFRNLHESSPVTTNYGTFDADELSSMRLQEAYDHFESLPTVVDGILTWKLADNSFVGLTKVEILDALTQLKVNRSVRAALLHVKAEQFNSQDPKPSLNFLSDINNWLT